MSFECLSHDPAVIAEKVNNQKVSLEEMRAIQSNQSKQFEALNKNLALLLERTQHIQHSVATIEKSAEQYQQKIEKNKEDIALIRGDIAPINERWNNITRILNGVIISVIVSLGGSMVFTVFNYMTMSAGKQ